MDRHNEDTQMKMHKPLIRLYVWTNRFLGSPEMAASFLELIRNLDGGKWAPEHWAQFEPVKEAFTSDSDARIIARWTEERQGRTSNLMFFKRGRPKLFLNVTVWRGRVPDLNYLYCDLDADQFRGVEGVGRLKDLIIAFIIWSNAVYATAYHTLQSHDRSASGNPIQRLERLNWLSFFGQPYIDMFGEERIRTRSFHSCEMIANGLLVTASESPHSSSMVESGDRLIMLEKCLGADVFAGDSYPEVACTVPTFNLETTANRR